MVESSQSSGDIAGNDPSRRDVIRWGAAMAFAPPMIITLTPDEAVELTSPYPGQEEPKPVSVPEIGTPLTEENKVQKPETRVLAKTGLDIHQQKQWAAVSLILGGASVAVVKVLDRIDKLKQQD